MLIYYKRYHFRELIFMFIFRTRTRSTLIMKMLFVPFILAMFLAHFHSADGRISLGNRMFGGAKFGPAKKEQGKTFSGQHFSGICVQFQMLRYRYTKFCFCILKISFLQTRTQIIVSRTMDKDFFRIRIVLTVTTHQSKVVLMVTS